MADPPRPREQVIKEWTQFALLLFASVWGVYTFVYKEIIVPARRPATLTVSGTLEELGRKGNMALIRARVHAVNSSNAKIYVPAFWYTATGVRLQPARSSETPVKSVVEAGLKTPLEGIARYSAEAGDVVAVWRLPGMEVWYEPGDETTNEELFYVPVDSFEAIRLKVDVIGAKGIDRLAGVQWTVGEDGSLFPQLLLKKRSYLRKSSRVEPFNSFVNRRHRRWELKNRVGHNWSISTLSLIRPSPR
jgi:hypothetical protein